MKTNSCLQELSSHRYNLNKWTANHRPGSSTIPDLNVGEFHAVQKAITGVYEQIIQHCTSCISRCEIAQLLLLNIAQLGHLHVAVAVREGVVAAQAPQDASNKPGGLSKHSHVTPPHLSSESNTISVGNFIIEDVLDRDVIVGLLLRTRALYLAGFIKGLRDKYIDHGHDDCGARLDLVAKAVRQVFGQLLSEKAL